MIVFLVAIFLCQIVFGIYGMLAELWSRPGSGTEVESTVPAATAYRSPRSEPTNSRPRVSAAE